ncbi:MAG TPA: TIGR03000 domain-containing protein [Gemmataceae bacterium]|nr:TIGR03000 domain-containing protein [Gemmataceae bacterium]
MVRIRTQLVLGLAGLALWFQVPPLMSRQGAAAQPALLRVQVPAGAELLVDGTRTKQTGSERYFQSPPLPAGRKFIYSLKATWKEDGKEVVREEVARVEAGQETIVDLRQAAPGKEAKAADNPSQSKEVRKPKREPDIFFLPTPQAVVDRMLELADLKKDDVVYDLGCGDGRFVVTAAEKYGVKATGFDIDPERVKDSLENVKKHHVEKLVTIKEADIFELDLRPASVVTLYLLPELNEKLMPQLSKLRPGSRILSHDFPMDGAKPKKVERMKVKNDRGEESEHTIYLWTVPWEMEKP